MRQSPAGLPWWNPRGLNLEYRVVIGLLVWLGLLALGSVVISLPYFSESSAAANIIYGHVMYLHGLLITMVGLLALIAMDVFACTHKGIRSLILWGTLGAALLSGVGGIFDRSVTDTVGLWMQIVSFLFLDEILVTLTIGLVIRARATGALVTWVAAVAAASAFGAALMGHLAGWLIEFGPHPAILSAYAHLMGVSVSTWIGFLVTSHSHEMVVAVLALLTATLVAAFGDNPAQIPGRWLRIGLWDVLIGTVLMTIIYVVAAFTPAQPPTLFAFGPHGVNGLAGDDLVTGLGVMLGSTIALLALGLAPLKDSAVRWAAAVFSVLILLTVVGAGYYIEWHEAIFGAGATAPGSTSDAIFTFWHQDFAFFIVPSVMIMLLVVHRMVLEAVVRRQIAVLMVGGGLVAFLGGLAYVFVDPVRTGFAFDVTAVGFVCLIGGLARTVWALAASAVTPRATG